MTHPRPWAVVGVAAALIVTLGAGCSGEDASRPPDPEAARPPADDEPRPATPPGGQEPGGPVYVAEALDPRLVVRDDHTDSAEPLVTLAADEQVSGKVVCLVLGQVGDWLEVRLPGDAPEGTGWVARSDVAVTRHDFRIEVARRDHTLRLYSGRTVALTAPVALGPDAPPAGRELFVTELVHPPRPDGPYRAYAYGLSGSANDLAAFTAGTGVVAVHGVADPAGLGTDVPRGSVGVAPDVVTRMADVLGLPLGTPVTVVG